MENYLVLTFYKFKKIPQEQLTELRTKLELRGEELGLKGLMIFGSEGCNTTLSGADEACWQYCENVKQILDLDSLQVKECRAPQHPFRRFKVKIREEIVTLGKPEILPLGSADRHLSPEEWHRVLSEEDVVLLDTRNWYETKMGKFKGALDPNTDEFHEFPDYLQKVALPKDKKILIYCTGGIRCEKAIVEMSNQGFENVFQLEGGIINYLQKFPNEKFEGECFVFDHRVALDQELKPTTKYKMCPHCGQPATANVVCRKCEGEAIICEECIKSEHKHTCSKNCAHHYDRNRETKGRRQEQGHRWESIKKWAKASPENK